MVGLSGGGGWIRQRELYAGRQGGDSRKIHAPEAHGHPKAGSGAGEAEAQQEMSHAVTKRGASCHFGPIGTRLWWFAAYWQGLRL